MHACACCKVEARMRNASRLIREWSKTHGAQSLPAHWCLTRGKLGLKTGKFCHLHGKGWHTTVVLQFLIDFAEDKANIDPLLKDFLSILQDHRKQSTLLTSEIIQQVLAVGGFFPKVLPPLGCEVQEILPIFAFQCATEISFADALHTCV